MLITYIINLSFWISTLALKSFTRWVWKLCNFLAKCAQCRKQIRWIKSLFQAFPRVQETGNTTYRSQSLWKRLNFRIPRSAMKNANVKQFCCLVLQSTVLREPLHLSRHVRNKARMYVSGNERTRLRTAVAVHLGPNFLSFDCWLQTARGSNKFNTKICGRVFSSCSSW